MDPLTAAGKKTKRQEAGGIEEGGQKKAIAREEGRKIEKRRRSKRSGRRREVEKEEEKSSWMEVERRHQGHAWRSGIRLDGKEHHVANLTSAAITLGPGSPARPVFRRDLTKYVADSFVGSAG